MTNRFHMGLLVIGLAVCAAAPARACGDGEAPCGEASDAVAKQMLRRVVAALAADKTAALGKFQRGEGGFRTTDTYVFCVGPDGIMTAHPSPMLQGQDVRELHDQTGNYFIASMLKEAVPGHVSEIHYLFPRPGGSVAEPKITYYTRAGDQVCGVGRYEGDEASPATAPSLPELRRRLDAAMPDRLRADWNALMQIEDEQARTQQATAETARAHILAAQAMLAPGPSR